MSNEDDNNKPINHITPLMDDKTGEQLNFKSISFADLLDGISFDRNGRLVIPKQRIIDEKRKRKMRASKIRSRLSKKFFKEHGDDVIYITNHRNQKVKTTVRKALPLRRKYGKMRKDKQEEIEKKRAEKLNKKLYDMEDNMDFATSQDNTPKRVCKRREESSIDVEPRWRAEDPRKRMSWPEFCRDFLGQNYGAIAQSMLELYQNDKDRFMKYAIEMGKQGNPQSLNIDVSGSVQSRLDIYSTLADMTRASDPNLIPENIPAQHTAEITDYEELLINQPVEPIEHMDNNIEQEQQDSNIINQDNTSNL